MKIKKYILSAITASIIFLNPTDSKAVCNANPAQILNTLTDICYSCIFPLAIAGIQVIHGPMPDPQGVVGSPICICPAPPPLFIRIGIPIGYFEPDRMIDVVKDPYCFMGMGFEMPSMGSISSGTKGDGADRQRVFYQSHYYIYPVLEVLGVLMDFLCMSSNGIDLAYLTEVDPLWQDDELSALINPEALLFGNPVTNLTCMTDSVSSQANVALDPLFWCKGSWGNAYPLSGNTGNKDYVEDAASVAASMIYKLHRELILWGSAGKAGLCGEFPMPIWKKSSYRLQILAPIAHPIASAIGQSGLLWSFLKNLPAGGDNFTFMLFKKRECCML
ncbi:conjugative transfer system protein TraU [Campylobacter subantarcticus LMG 24377]|uniref:Conjugative transfer system protein TraU n=1 Tax=Campylobacter subantarcticus TaxID=497724 RepID=A0ABW9N6R7_9BACT|nr:conjugative transfer system protein TraU [Campylobacter subantarcticus]AJC92198.1 conjugative transfer system protein TraU [Campylobacter subantarcticus LMG 24377]EAL3938374.1 conjugative transfer system protein TraU [Campylobacter lari]MPB99965.1 conjugative transfer system protein TraU [Campylobacter subantarcticus]